MEAKACDNFFPELMEVEAGDRTRALVLITCCKTLRNITPKQRFLKTVKIGILIDF